jgi:hypothetical protein
MYHHHPVAALILSSTSMTILLGTKVSRVDSVDDFFLVSVGDRVVGGFGRQVFSEGLNDGLRIECLHCDCPNRIEGNNAVLGQTPVRSPGPVLRYKRNGRTAQPSLR